MNFEAIQERLEYDVKKDEIVFINMKQQLQSDPYVNDLVTYIHSMPKIKKLVKTHLDEYGGAIVQPIYCKIFGIPIPTPV